MKAALDNPIYTVYAVSGSTKYNLTDVLVDIRLSDHEKQLAQCATITVMNAKVGGSWLSSILRVRSRIFIYANDGKRNDEVFRGFVWTRGYKSALEERDITIKCYDILMYFQESDDTEYFSEGKTSQDIISKFCSKWGVSVDYSYDDITHSKLALRGNLADIFTADVLDLVKDRTGKEYLIRAEKDVMKIMGYGQNPTVYTFAAKQNATLVKSEETMDGMVTKVVIIGKADDKSDREPVEATISGDTGQYGTLQEVLIRDENTDLDEAKKEAQGILKKDGAPKWEYEVKAVDVPWIRKGDKVRVNAGDIANQTLIVASVDHNISNSAKEITMTLKKEV